MEEESEETTAVDASQNGANNGAGEKSEPAKLDASMTSNGDDPMEQQPQQKKESTRTFAEKHDYDAQRLFNKLFNDDILYLLSMANLWKERKKPEPANYESLIAEGGGLLLLVP